MTDLFHQPLIRAVLWTIVILGGLLVISIIGPALRALLADGRSGMARLRQAVTRWVDDVIVGRWVAFWRERQSEPLEPVLVGLRRIDFAARELGREQIRSLQGIEGRLTDHVRLLRAAAAPDAVAAAPDTERMARAIGRGGFGTIVILLFLALALGGINASLLSVFFREFIGARSPLPTLFPELQMGHVLAILFFILEVSSGWLIYRYTDHSDGDEDDGPRRSAAEIFFLGTAWFLLVSLAIIETIAYAVLSDRFHIPQQLQIPIESPFYSITRYFFALFGLALTAALAGIGHALGDAFHARRRAGIEKRLIRAIERRDETLVSAVERVRDSVVTIQKAATELPTTVATSFGEGLGLSHPYPPTPLMLHSGTVGVLSSADPEIAPALLAPGVVAPPKPRIRSRTQVVADFAIQLAIAAVLGVVGTLTTLEVVAWIRVQSDPLSPPLAWAAGIGLAAALIVTGVLARNTLFRLKYATPVEQSLTDDRGRRRFGFVVIGVALALVAVTSTLAVQVGALGGSILLNAMLGVAQAAVLVAVGGWLDSALAALIHLGYLVWLAATLVVAAALAVAEMIVEGAVAIIEFLVRLLSIPGDAIRGFRDRGVKAPSGGISASVPGGVE